MRGVLGVLHRFLNELSEPTLLVLAWVVGHGRYDVPHEILQKQGAFGDVARFVLVQSPLYQLRTKLEQVRVGPIRT